MTENSLQNVIKSAEKAGNAAGGASLPPVEDWDPPYCGDIGMRIVRDGTWFYGDSPIGREKLVRLFSTILRRNRAANRSILESLCTTAQLAVCNANS